MEKLGSRILDSIKLYIKEFYKSQKIYFTATENLSEKNIFEKIVFDIESLGKTTKQITDFKKFTLVDFDEEKKKI